jgi:glycosyltransferase involved in cell wall biosynthesis
MPAYNAGKYIGEALDSVLAQTFTDWECIVVDDCSPDRTEDVVKDYAARDPRIKYHRLDTNSGSARVPLDMGVAMAHGEWLVFMGHDDMLAPDMLRLQMERQGQTGADIVLVRMVHTLSDGTPTGVTTPARSFDMTQVLTGRQAVMLTIGKWIVGANGMLMRKELKLRTQYRGTQMNADEYYTRELMLLADSVAFADTEYFYRSTPDSITRKISPKLFETVITDWDTAGLLADSFGMGSDEHLRAQRNFHSGLLRNYIVFGRHRRKLDPDQRKQVSRLLREYRGKATRRTILGLRGLPWYKKMLLILPPAALESVARIIPRKK